MFCVTNMSVTVEQLRSILDEKLTPLKLEIDDLRTKLSEAMKFLDFANTKCDEVIIQLAKQEQENKELQIELQALKSSQRAMEVQVASLEVSNNDLEQYSRRECLEIFGIPQKHSENTNVIVENIGRLIGVEIGENNISVSHRLPARKNRRNIYGAKKPIPNPGIIVKFTRRDMKDRLYKSRKQLKRFSTKELGFDEFNSIFINESLIQKNKAFFHDCLKVKKDQHFESIWTSNGKIFLRRDSNSSAIQIKNKFDLQKLSR